MTRRTEELVEGALGLAARGIPTILLRPRSKIPIHRNWPALGMLDPESIRIERGLNPDANIGVVGGPGALHGRGLVIVDVDEPDGPGVLRRLELEHGALPATLTVRTPSGGRHHYFTGHAPSWDPAPGLEVRSQGRQCAAPPSVLAAGEYRWEVEREPAELPWWLQVPARADVAPRGEFVPSGLQDPVLDVPPPTYFKLLTGLTPDRHGFVPCPVHPFPDLEPSCRVYDTAERGWFCFGAGCRKGGDVVSLAAHLAGIPTPVRGREFVLLLDYLAGRLL
jgi:hypothetical protein